MIANISLLGNFFQLKGIGGLLMVCAVVGVPSTVGVAWVEQQRFDGISLL